ncbi:MAG: DUF3418 domain-containing protein, partial [Deltaproteobacteria bacterium]|nr:DUF3418 domain-containing protein [Deltaproteobacteria bacterium]
KTIAIRAQRGVDNLEKDRQRGHDIRAVDKALNTLIRDLDDATSNEKRAAVEALFWHIQEYKVSVFAQELKTAVPVSKKKLEQQIKAIERMI